MKQGVTWTKVGERIGKICVGDSKHIGLAGVGIIEDRFGKGKWTLTEWGFFCPGKAVVPSKHCSKLPSFPLY